MSGVRSLGTATALAAWRGWFAMPPIRASPPGFAPRRLGAGVPIDAAACRRKLEGVRAHPCTHASSATALWTFDRVFPCADAPPPSDHEIVRPSAFAVGPCWSSVTPLWSGICCAVRSCVVTCFVVEFRYVTVSIRASKPTTLHRDRLTTCAPDANMPKGCLNATTDILLTRASFHAARAALVPHTHDSHTAPA